MKKRRPALSAARTRLKKLLVAAGLQRAEVSVLFVGDTAMRSLNRRYRRKDRTTDVLSFAFREDGSPGFAKDLLGDIVISVPCAERQARMAGDPVRKEIDRLLVHGLLHLLGFDHERGGTDARRMQDRERTLMEVLER